jgi:GAF domain-containing protein
MSDTTRITNYESRLTDHASLLQRLHQASRAIAAASDEAAVGQALMDFAARGDVHAARLLIFADIVDGHPTTIEMREGWTIDSRPAQPYGTRLSLADYPLLGFMHADATVVCEDVATDERLNEPTRRLMAVSGLSSFAIIPLTATAGPTYQGGGWSHLPVPGSPARAGLRQGGMGGGASGPEPGKDWLGVLIIGRDTLTTYAEELIYAWWTLAGQAAAIMQNARLHKETQQRLKELSLLLDTGATISTSLEVDKILHTTARQIANALAADGCAISTWDREQDTLITRLDYPVRPGLMGTETPGTIYRLAAYPASRQVLASRQPLVVQASDPRADPAEVAWMTKQKTASVLMVPMVMRDEAIGMLELLQSVSSGERAFTPTEIALCQALANQAAAALENARLFEQVQRGSVQLQTAAEVSRAASSILEPDQLIQQAVSLVRQRFDLYYAGLFLVDESGEWAVLHAGTGEAGRIQLEQGHKLKVGGESMVGWCIANAQTHITLHAQEEGRRFVNPLLPETRSEMALPLISRGQVIGAMTIQSTQEAAFSQEDIAALQTLADQLANAIQNARLLEERAQRTEELATLNLIATVVSRSLQVQDLLEEALEAVIAATGYDAGLMSIYDEEADHLCLAAQRGLPEPLVRLFDQQGLGGTLCEVVFQTPHTMGIGDVRQGAPIDVSSLIRHGLRAYAGIPLVYQTKTLGTLCLFSRSARDLSTAQFSLLEAIGRQIGVGIANARLFEQTQARATELSVLFDISQKLNSASLRPLGITEIVARQLLEMGDVECSFSLLDDDGDTLRVLTDLFVKEGEIVHREKPRETFRLSDYPATARVMETLQPLVMQASAPDADPAELAYMREPGVETLAIFPLAVKGRAIGVMELESPQARHYTPEQLNLIVTLANQAAAALDNARLFEETQARARTEEQLRQVLAMINISEDLLTDLPAIAGQLCGLAPADVVALVSYTPGESECTYYAAAPSAESQPRVAPGVRIPLKGSGPAWVIANKRPWLQADIRQEPGFGEDEGLISQNVRARLILPLQIGEQVVGTLNLGSEQPGAFTKEHLPPLRQVADQLALALERARLLEEIRAALAEVQATHQRYLREAWESMLAASAERTWGYLDGPHGLTATDEVWTPEIEQVVVTGELTTISAPDADAGKVGRSALAIPIKLRGQIIGVLDFYDEERVWTEDDKALVGALADQLALALENARLFEQTQRRAYRERLTGEIVGKIRAAGDVHSILETAAQELGRALGVSRARVRLGSPTDGSRRPVELAASPRPDIQKDTA